MIPVPAYALKQDYIAGRLPIEREALAELLAPGDEPSEALGLVRLSARLLGVP